MRQAAAYAYGLIGAGASIFASSGGAKAISAEIAEELMDDSTHVPSRLSGFPRPQGEFGALGSQIPTCSRNHSFDRRHRPEKDRA